VLAGSAAARLPLFKRAKAMVGHLLALAAASLFSAAAFAACIPGDGTGTGTGTVTITLGSTATSVPNRRMADCSTVDEQIADEQAWGSQAAFLAHVSGGDGFAVLVQGGNRLGGAVDTDAFAACLQANAGGVAPGPMNRITRLN